MMKLSTIGVLAAALAVAPALADSPDLETLQRQCKNEQSSQFKERNGTPSCDQLDRIYYRAQTQQGNTVIIHNNQQNTDIRPPASAGAGTQCSADGSGGAPVCR
jgi:hypothetical protein